MQENNNLQEKENNLRRMKVLRDFRQDRNGNDVPLVHLMGVWTQATGFRPGYRKKMRKIDFDMSIEIYIFVMTNINAHGGKTCHSMTGIFYACNFDIRRFSYPCVGVLMHPQPWAVLVNRKGENCPYLFCFSFCLTKNIICNTYESEMYTKRNYSGKDNKWIIFISNN